MVLSNKEWLEFIKLPKTNKQAKTDVYAVKNKQTKAIIGEIKWYSAWREYCYMYYDPNEELILAPSCLEQMARFIRGLMRKRKF